MTTDHMELRAAAASSGNPVLDDFRPETIAVSRLDLQELLAAYDALAHPAAPKGKYSAEFEEAWAEYPKRPGNSKADAYIQWNARMKKGATPEQMVEGTRRYAAYCKATGKEGEFIKQGATFFGRGEHYTLEWELPRAVEPRRQLPDRREIIKETDAQRAENRDLWGIPELPPSSFDSGVIDANQ